MSDYEYLLPVDQLQENYLRIGWLTNPIYQGLYPPNFSNQSWQMTFEPRCYYYFFLLT